MSEQDQARAGIPGWTVAVGWIGSVVLSYLGIGGLLDRNLEGVIPKASPLLWVIPVLFFIATIVLTIVWARGVGRGAAPDADAPKGMGRRRFLAGAGVTLGGTVVAAVAPFARISGWLTTGGRYIQPAVPTSDPNPSEHWQGSRVHSYRRLGRTGVEVSDIALGSGRIHPDRDGEEIARLAIERGVNYFDTAPDYSETGSEIALGRALKGRRDRIFVATKFCTPHGHLEEGTPVEQYMKVVEESLVRLQTDYVDLVHIHSCDTVERLLDPNAHEAFDRLKQQGKVRFLGVSTHTPNLEQVANAAIDSDRFDVMMLAYHYGAWPRLGEIIDRAAANDIGVVAMKTLRGSKHHGLLWDRDERDSYTQASFKWVLSNPSVACLVISLWESGQLDEFLYASGRQPTTRDLAVLERYGELVAETHCRPHCGVCLESCPEGLPIHDVLRHRMYYEDYGAEKEAMRRAPMRVPMASRSRSGRGRRTHF
jgi:aryl-alcohol dehydrogenase-like predicted oxidoreductase